VENKISPLKWIYSNSKRYFLGIAFLVVIGALLSLTGVYFALLSRDVIDVATGRISGEFTQSAIKLALLIAFQLLLQVSFALINVRVLGKLNITLKKKLFGTLLKKDWLSVSAYHSGELLNRLTSDISIVSSAVVGIIPSLISYATRIVASFAALFMLDFTFALICITVGPVILIFARIYSKKMKGLHKDYQQSDGITRSFMQETLQNLLVIKSFGNEDSIVENSTALQNKNYKISLKRNNIGIVANLCFYIAITVGYYFALAWGAYKISVGIMSFGTLTAILQLVGQVQMPFKDLSGILPQYYGMVASAERIIELENLPDEAELNDEILNTKETYEKLDEIVMKNVSFSYNKEKVLDDISFTMKKGEFVAVSGISGTGKSTFLKLILGMITPTCGSSYLLLRGGEKIELDKHTRGMFAYVPQGNMILSGTIRENILFAKKDILDDEIIKSAKVSMIWDYIETLPQGLDTMLGEKGLGLSEGQIQRIAIARAVLHNSPILLLDEATSALDEQTEEAVLKNLKALNEKSCIIISHKKAAHAFCDKSINFM